MLVMLISINILTEKLLSFCSDFTRKKKHNKTYPTKMNVRVHGVKVIPVPTELKVIPMVTELM